MLAPRDVALKIKQRFLIPVAPTGGGQAAKIPLI